MTIADMENTVPKLLLKRRNELQSSVFVDWVSGLEVRAAYYGLTGMFIRLNASHSSHKELEAIWKNVQAGWNRNITFGVRIVWPDEMGRPTWVLFVWCKPSNEDWVWELLRRATDSINMPDESDTLLMECERITKAGQMTCHAINVKKNFDRCDARKIAAWASMNCVSQYQVFGQ